MSRLRMKVRLLRWLKKEQGSFTLESTIVFPILMGLILLFILFGIYMYQKVVLYYAASATAERAAFSWDNSFRLAKSGMLIRPEYDGLYWRIGKDEMLSSFFGLGGEKSAAVVTLPLADADETGRKDLSERKIEQSVQWLGQAGLKYEGQISYSGGVLKREIEVKLKSPLSVHSIEDNWLLREPKTVSAAAVVDPVELIRSIDLMRYYTTKFANRTGGAGQSRSQASQALASYEGGSEVQKP